MTQDASAKAKFLHRRDALCMATGAAIGAAAATGVGMAWAQTPSAATKRKPSDFRILDIHEHVITSAPGYDAAKDQASRLAFMDANGIEQTLVLPAFGYPHPNGLADTSKVNELVAAYRDRNPKRFPAAFGTVDPLDGPGAADEIDRCVTQLGMRGMVWHPRFTGVSIDHPAMTEFLKRVEAHNIPAFIHIVAESKLESAWKVGVLAERFPKVTFVALDTFSGVDQGSFAPYLGKTRPNLNFDTGMLLAVGSGMENFLKSMGPDRLFLGTDAYSQRGFALPYPVYEILASEYLSDDDCRKILGGNARKLLKLT